VASLAHRGVAHRGNESFWGILSVEVEAVEERSIGADDGAVVDVGCGGDEDDAPKKKKMDGGYDEDDAGYWHCYHDDHPCQKPHEDDGHCYLPNREHRQTRQWHLMEAREHGDAMDDGYESNCCFRE